MTLRSLYWTVGLWIVSCFVSPTTTSAFVTTPPSLSSTLQTAVTATTADSVLLLSGPKQSAATAGDANAPDDAHGTSSTTTSSSSTPTLFQTLATKTAHWSFAVALTIATTTTAALVPIPAHATSYNALTDEQKVVAEAWRLVDNSFLDRTFNGQDWFNLRQTAIYKQKYRTMEQAQQAMEQMIGTLGDKYTRYLSPSKYQSIVDSATGTLAGVGVEIATDEQGYVIASDVEENSPAKTAGIRPGDKFLAVDGVEFADQTATPDDVAVRVRGPVGSRVGVVMERDGKTLDFIITRQPITITSVKSYLSNMSGVGKVGVIRIKSFSGTTSSKVASQLADLKKQGAKAFVIDVRGNPGGLLPGGADTASLFLDANKPIVFVVNKKGVVDSQSTINAGIELEAPLVILADRNTASAAEVFTAALQENGRAVVAGEQTFGKGIVQTIRELSNNQGGVAITVARYETPKHRDINKQGIPVDVKTSVSCPKDDATACLTASVFKQND